MAKAAKTNDLFAGMSKVNVQRTNVHTSMKNNKPENDDYDKIYKTKDYSIFENYPNEELRLHLHKGEKREALKRSIEAQGITTPVKVIKVSDYQGSTNGMKDTNYIILGGHNRVDIARELGVEVPYIILQNKTLADCDQIVSEEHLLNRQATELKPSEIAHLLKAMKYDTFTADINELNDPVKGFKFSKSSYYRYLSLNNLIPEILQLVDSNDISFKNAINLTGISRDKQSQLFDFIHNNNIKKINTIQSKELQNKKDLEWNTDLFNSIFYNNNEIINKSISFQAIDLLKYIPEQDIKNAKEIIQIALKEYYENHSK